MRSTILRVNLSLPLHSFALLHRGQETKRQRVASVEDNRSLPSERASRGRESSVWEQFDRAKNELEGVGEDLDRCLEDIQLHEDYCDLRGSQMLAFRDHQEDLGSLSFNTFVRCMRSQEVQAIALISQVNDIDLELRTSSTFDVNVLDEAPGASLSVGGFVRSSR
jgi:hypothetical protein